MEALITMAMVITGSASDCSADAGSAQSSRGNPPDGNQRRFTAKASTSRMPTQNTGTAMPSCEKADSTRPYQRSAFQAATKPIGNASTSASTNDRRVSGMVTASREAISGPTGSDVMKDCPRFSVSSEPNQFANCSGRGRLLPTCSCAALIWSGVALADSRALAGSPGSTRSRKNSTTIASSRDTTRNAVRRRR